MSFHKSLTAQYLLFKTIKKMNATVDVILYKSKTLSNGEHPLMLKITKDGQRKYVSLKLSLNENEWDVDKGKPRKSHPDKDKINKIIQAKIKEYESKILDFKMEDMDYTINTLVDKVNLKVQKLTVEQYVTNLIQSLKSENRLGSAATYQDTLNSLRRFQSMNIYFSHIDIAWLKKYEAHLREYGNNENTLGIRFRTLRAIYNKAIEENIVKKDYYPFDSYKVSKLKKATAKRAITKEHIMQIINVDTKQVSRYYCPLMELSKDLFLFSYFSCGMNLVDMAHLKYSNIIDGKLVYERRKTGKLLKFELQPTALNIMAKYQKEDSYKDDYVFPILNHTIHKTEEQKRNRVLKVNKAINKSLGKIGVFLNLPIQITTYVARHTYATVLKRSGVNIAIISESLGHSDISTTQIYLDSFDNEQISKAMMNL